MYANDLARPGVPGAEPALIRSVRFGFPQPHDAPDADVPDEALTAERAVYHRDLLRPYGLELDEGALAKGGRSYGEMGRALIDRVLRADEPVDLLILAYAVPDLDPGRATATYLSHVCPGHPMAFAISDQGADAAATGVRLIREYARTGGVRRALLLVVERAALPYDPGVPIALPSGDSGVALLFGEAADDADGDGGGGGDDYDYGVVGGGILP